MLINLLGIDGVGKTTHIKNLIEDIQNEFKVKVRIITKADIMNKEIFPEADLFRVPYSVLAIECLPFMKGNSRAMWLLYMFTVILGKFPPVKNEIILFDGFWHKHYAAETALGVDEDWFESVCKMFPEVDYTLVLDIEPELILKRSPKSPTPYECGLDVKCTNESFIDHQEKVRKKIMDLMSKKNNYDVIDARESKEVTYEKIKSNIFSKLKVNMKEVR